MSPWSQEVAAEALNLAGRPLPKKSNMDAPIGQRTLPSPNGLLRLSGFRQEEHTKWGAIQRKKGCTTLLKGISKASDIP